MKKGGKQILGASILIVLGVFLNTRGSSALTQTASIRARVLITVCGNNVKETGEDCDNADLGGANCASLGYVSGWLACRADCTFNKTNCTNVSNAGGTITSGGIGGGAGGGTVSTKPEIQIILQGRAFPNASVYLLKDGRLVGQSKANANSDFSMEVGNVGTGDSNLMVYALDVYGNRSPVLTLRTNIAPNTITRISRVYVPPTVSLNTTVIKKGGDLIVSGQTCASCKIRILVNSLPFATISSEATGVFVTGINTSSLPLGKNEVLLISDWGGGIIEGDSIEFTVTDKDVAPTPSRGGMRGDLNRDNKVNLVDFSIAAFWYKRKLSTAMTQIESEALNGDNKMDLVDFSIMAYFWTEN